LSDKIVITVLSSVAIALLGWLVTRTRAMVDRRRVYAWLRSNTRDEPGESHVDILTLVKGTRLPEERVSRACFSNKWIHRSSGSSEQWSVWREQPQSIYEKRGIDFF
jgi:hypothetical protein